MWVFKISFTFAVEESLYRFRLLYTQLSVGLLVISVNMGWESSLMSWFDTGKLVEASLLLLVVGSGFTTNAASSRAAHTFGVIPFSLVVFCVVSWPCGVSW